ncbi:universal stress protein [Thermaurantimonas aggregans]|uniref:Universal stress protein n=1 Tax=Thermaurantimonas aggregans TaxID=2173829 RepID=A0A401XIM3_9FLAO|nr:universal stress protein [Thermaurantimonas aggregans]MCX8148815.1 universal stress protein [Thermaurantimonas aggregans]GCD76872.1 universal stress protein [Thermaurantimonas aggregans]
MKTIIFPTDYSANADKALDFAIDFAKKTGAKIIALNAYDLPYAETVMTHSLLEIMKENSEAGMKKVEEKLQSAGIPYETRCLVGNPIRLVKKAVEDEGADMVILGTKGASGIEEILIGSNAASILQSVTVPVITIPAGSHFSNIRKIVFGADFKSKRNGTALIQLAEIASIFNAEVVIAHVIVNYGIDNQTVIEAKQRISEYLKGISHRFEVLSGENVEDTLLQFAAEDRADMIALMSRNYSFFESIFHKSVTTKVAYHSKLPYLALHEDAN